MRLFEHLYWRTDLWRLHQRVSRVVGRITCWWTGEHEEIWTVGSMVPDRVLRKAW